VFGGPVAGQDERFGGDGSVADEAVVVALMIGAAAFSMVLSVNDLVLPSTPPWSLRRRPEPFDDRLDQITWPLLLDFEMTGELLTQVGREVMPNVPALATTTPTAGCCWLRTQARNGARGTHAEELGLVGVRHGISFAHHPVRRMGHRPAT
jgi:hypothetical protein